MKKCTECGNELLPEWKFCPMCGRELQDDSKNHLSRAEELFLVGKALSIEDGFGTAALSFVKEAFPDSKFHSENEIEAFDYYKKSAALGNAEAKIMLSRCFQIGIGLGTEKNYKEAIGLLKETVGYDSAVAQAMIGSMYLQGGYGIERDANEAVKWLKLAVENDNDIAQYLLGRCYYYGNGVEKNLKESKRLLQLSAKQKYILAKNLLSELFGK